MKRRENMITTRMTFSDVCMCCAPIIAIVISRYSCFIANPSETHHKLISREISYAQNFFNNFNENQILILMSRCCRVDKLYACFCNFRIHLLCRYIHLSLLYKCLIRASRRNSVTFGTIYWWWSLHYLQNLFQSAISTYELLCKLCYDE